MQPKQKGYIAFSDASMPLTDTRVADNPSTQTLAAVSSSQSLGAGAGAGTGTNASAGAGDAGSECSAEHERLGAKRPFRTLFLQSLGPLVSTFLTSLFNILNSVFVARALPDANAALSAITIAGPIEYICNAFGYSFLVGAASTISACLGRKDFHGAKLTVLHTLVTSLVSGVLITVCFLPGARQMLQTMASSDDSAAIITMAYEYSRILLVFAPVTCMYLTAVGIASGSGFVKLTAILNGVSFVINTCVVTPGLLFGTRVGIMGASIGVIVSQAVPLCVYIYFFLAKMNVKLDFRLLRERVTFRYMRQVFLVAIIDFIASISGSVLLGVLANFVSQIADLYAAGAFPDDPVLRKGAYEEVLAAWGCLSRIYQMAIGICYGISGGYLPAASYAFSMAGWDRFLKLTKWLFVYDCLFLLVVGVVMIGVVRWFAMIFSASPLYLDVATVISRVMLITCGILPLQFVVTTVCQAANMILRGGIVACVTQILLLPVIFITVFYATAGVESMRADQLRRLYICIASFNINDVLSGVIALPALWRPIRKWRALARQPPAESDYCQ